MLHFSAPVAVIGMSCGWKVISAPCGPSTEMEMPQPLSLLCWPSLATTSRAIRANAGVRGLTKMESHQAFLATSAIRS